MLGILLIFLGVLSGYLTRSVFNESAFASRVVASLRNPHFANFVAEQIADAVIKAKPDLVGLRPVLVGIGRSVVSSPPFLAAVRRSARAAHHAIMSGTGRNIVLSVKDLSVVVGSMTEEHPKLAKKIPPRLTAALANLDSLPGGERTVQLARIARRSRLGALGFLLLGVAVCGVGVWLSLNRRRALVQIGVAAVVLGVVLAVVARFGGFALGLLARQEQNAAPLAGLAQAFLSGLMAWAIAVGFAGLVVAAASASLLERVPLRRWGDGVWVWLTGPQPLMRYRLLRGLLGALAGAALLAWPAATLVVVASLGGLVAVFVGLREAFVGALHLMPRIDAPAPREAGARPVAGGAVALLFAIALAAPAAVAWLVLRSGASPPVSHEFAACNGSAALCDRTLDQVVFPTSHNSMAGADVPRWMFPNQDAGIQKQLADGVRAFMIDAHYGFPFGDRVKTDLENETAAMAKYEAVLGKEGVVAALRVRDRMTGEKLEERDVYMCHGFCELGALPLVPVLRDVRDFLVANPGEVLIFVIQDESVSPQDMERCFQESGLIDFVYRGPARPPWPTLREMVESDQRVLVMAENATPGVAWYHPAFQVLQETPYQFHDPSEFSNRPGRGGTGGSLLLLNHWIETTPLPKPSNAAIVNAHDALMARIRACRRERGRIPNLVAVDFYGTGDLVQVVRELNEQPVARRASR